MAKDTSKISNSVGNVLQPKPVIVQTPVPKTIAQIPKVKPTQGAKRPG